MRRDIVPEAMTCVVCGQPVDENSGLACSLCGHYFHLKSQKGEGQDCGLIMANPSGC